MTAVAVRPPATISVPIQLAAVVLVVLGCALETLAEQQRRHFWRTHPGQICDAGLFGVVRHPNYAAFVLYRTAAMAATGRILPTLAVAALCLSYFRLVAVPGARRRRKLTNVH